MHQGKTFLAIIPARGGSKGLQGKNIKDICGKPLIAWSVEAGLGSKHIDEVKKFTANDMLELFGARLTPNRLMEISISFSR